ncbi:MAG TPA: hypothetical protein VLO07_03795 [Thermoanaerobaculia bacterium]|nr:hypothetical protein [Thermoanaerobaculia bacterium]
MTRILWLWLVLMPADSRPVWQELTLSIEKDRYSSSDTITLCRVRVVNNGQHTWSGSALRFEARALEGERAVARETGRFGLWLAPHETLETLIAFVGLYERFEVRPLPGAAPREARRKAHGGNRHSKSEAGKRKTGSAKGRKGG